LRGTRFRRPEGDGRYGERRRLLLCYGNTRKRQKDEDG
jgi:hypothetical protein